MHLTGKIQRKVLSYWSRQCDWIRLLREVRGNTFSDAVTLYSSALLGPLTGLRELGWYRPPIFLADLELRERRTGVFRIRKRTDDIFHIMWWREPRLFDLLVDTLRPGDVFIDAGANIGFYSMLASRLVGPDGQVHAIEMMPETARSLRFNLQASGAHNVTVHEVALSDTTDEMVEASFNPRFLGQASVTSMLGAARTQTVEVKTKRLDDLLRLDRVNFIKIDLEGNEFKALKGAENLLEHTELIAFENTTKDSSIDELLTSSGFVIKLLEGDDFVARKLKNAASH